MKCVMARLAPHNVPFYWEIPEKSVKAKDPPMAVEKMLDISD